MPADAETEGPTKRALRDGRLGTALHLLAIDLAAERRRSRELERQLTRLRARYQQLLGECAPAARERHHGQMAP